MRCRAALAKKRLSDAHKKNNIVLIGFMGSQRRAVAKKLAEKLSMKHIDTDAGSSASITLSRISIFDESDPFILLIRPSIGIASGSASSCRRFVSNPRKNRSRNTTMSIQVLTASKLFVQCLLIFRIALRKLNIGHHFLVHRYAANVRISNAKKQKHTHAVTFSDHYIKHPLLIQLLTVD